MPIGNPVTLTSNVASKTISVTATASQTLFNVTGGYRINSLGVFKNGLRLQDGVDYTARDGLTVTLLSAASGGDKLQFVVFDTFRVAEAIRPNVDEQTIRGNLNVVGILSATSLGGLTNFNLTSGITTFNDVRVGGALTVAGALTFEDVTNVDSVGIITAQSYVSIADSIVHTGDINTAIRFPAADTFTVETAGSERVRVTGIGSVGIGENDPTHLLDVFNSSDTTYTANDFIEGAIARLHNDSTTTDSFASLAFRSGSGDNAIGFKYTGVNQADFILVNDGGSNGVERLRITSGGNIGIGTTNPQQPIHLLASNPAIRLQDTGSNTSYAQVSGNGGKLYLQADDNNVQGSSAIEFHLDGDLKALIDSSGNVGINSTNPGNKLSVDGDIGLYGSGTNHRNLYIYKDNVATAWFKYRGDNNVVIIGNNAGDKLTINPSGDLNVAGIATATQLYEGTTRVATSGKAIAMALIFG